MQNQLKLKQTQQLQLNPQLQQAIKLLQMSGLELDEAVEQALLENPLLERVESDFSEESHEPEALSSEAESMANLSPPLGNSAEMMRRCGLKRDGRWA